MNKCVSCRIVPNGEDEIALAFMLTDKFLDQQRLLEASRLIKSGQSIQLPPAAKAAVMAALEGAKVRQAGADTNISGKALMKIIAIVAFIMFMATPWTHFQWASLRHSVGSYNGFLSRFPVSDYSEEAKERIRILREPEVWREADGSGQIEVLRSYLEVYHDGPNRSRAKLQISEIADSRWAELANTESKTEVLGFLKDFPETTKRTEAEARIMEIVDRKWSAVAKSRSVAELRKFIEDNPETTRVAEVENRIQELFNDFDWVKEQDDLDHYRRFSSRFPKHARIAEIEKRIIDLEVKEIAEGEYGEMPPAQPLSFGGATTQVTVENKTGYELTVRYSGPESKRLVLEAGDKQSVTLVPGDYKVAASVNADNVTNYYGTDSMKGGVYSSTFYIQSSFNDFRYPAPSGSTFRKRR
jgi:hypothetical protein